MPNIAPPVQQEENELYSEANVLCTHSTQWAGPLGSEDERLPSLRFPHPAERRAWTEEQKESFVYSYTKGKFSKTEKDNIANAIKLYMEEHRLQDEMELKVLVNPKAYKDAQVVASDKSLNFYRQIFCSAKINRSLDQLYTHLVRKYWPVVRDRTAYSKEEDEQLLHLIASKGQKWTEIRRIMQRSDIRNRWLRITREEDRNFGLWSHEETTEYLRHMFFMLVRNKNFDSRTFNSWLEIGTWCSNRDQFQCRAHWVYMLRRIAREINQVVIDLYSQKRRGVKIMDEYHNLLVEPCVSFEELIERCKLVPWVMMDDLELVNRLLTLCGHAIDENDVIWNYITSNDENWRDRTGDFLRQKWELLSSKVPSTEADTFNEKLRYCHDHIFEVSEHAAPFLLSEDYIYSEDEADDDDDEVETED